MKALTKLYKRIKSEYVWFTKGGVEHARYLGAKIGNNCRVFTKRFGSEPYLIEIGDHVTIASDVILLTHDGSTWLVRDEKGRRYTYKRLKIGSNVFIGTNSIIMPGVSIGNNVIVGAGSVVTKSVPDGYIIAGNPAKIISKFDDYKAAILQENLNEQDFKGTLSKKEIVTNFANKLGFRPELKRTDKEI